jgi:hypothetical protein
MKVLLGSTGRLTGDELLKDLSHVTKPLWIVRHQLLSLQNQLGKNQLALDAGLYRAVVRESRRMVVARFEFPSVLCGPTSRTRRLTSSDSDENKNL